MFALRFHVSLCAEEDRTPAPKAWLDQFFMRNFTGHRAFDETLPVADGLLESGYSVRPEEVRELFEKWLRGRKLIDPVTRLAVSEAERD